MKQLLLLSVALLCLGSISASSQATFTIDWNYPDTLHASETEPVVKRTGTMYNLNANAKQILFRYNIENVMAGHTVAFCFGDLCYFQFTGEDDPYERDAQDLTPNGSLPVYSLCNNANTKGTSTVWYEMFDKNDSTDKMSFNITYIFGEVDFVKEAQELGVEVFPSPTTDQLSLTGTQNVNGVDVYSSTGVLLRTYGIHPGSTLNLDVHDLPSGTYHLVLALQGGTVAQAPFVIVR